MRQLDHREEELDAIIGVLGKTTDVTKYKLLKGAIKKAKNRQTNMRMRNNKSQTCEPG